MYFFCTDWYCTLLIMDELPNITITDLQNEIEICKKKGWHFWLVFVNKSPQQKGKITAREFKKTKPVVSTSGKKTRPRTPRKKSSISIKDNRLLLVYDVQGHKPRHVSIDTLFFAKFGEDWYRINHG